MLRLLVFVLCLPIALSSAVEPARPAHPKLDPDYDGVGVWRVYRETPAARRETGRITNWGTDLILVGPPGAKKLVPKMVQIRTVGGVKPEWIPNPQYVDIPRLALVTLELSYYDGDLNPLGSILVAGEFACNEDGDANAGEVRREVQRRLDAGTLWAVSNTSLLVQRYLGDSTTVLDEQAPVPAPVRATWVEYRAYVPDPSAVDNAKLTVQIESSIAAASIHTQFPEASEEDVEAIILREISVAPRWKLGPRGLVQKTP